MIRIAQSAKLFPLSFESRSPAAGARWRLHLTRIIDALGAGAGTIPLGDNGEVFRALARSRELAERHSPATCGQA